MAGFVFFSCTPAKPMEITNASLPSNKHLCNSWHQLYVELSEKRVSFTWGPEAPIIYWYRHWEPNKKRVTAADFQAKCEYYILNGWRNERCRSAEEAYLLVVCCVWEQFNTDSAAQLQPTSIPVCVRVSGFSCIPDQKRLNKEIRCRSREEQG